MEKLNNSMCKFCYYRIRIVDFSPSSSLFLSLARWKTAYCYQNCVAHLTTCTREREPIRSVLLRLHWLPVLFRSLYKILFHAFKWLVGTAPLYLSHLIQRFIPARLLLSEPRSRFIVPNKNPYNYVRSDCGINYLIIWDLRQVKK